MKKLCSAILGRPAFLSPGPNSANNESKQKHLKPRMLGVSTWKLRVVSLVTLHLWGRRLIKLCRGQTDLPRSYFDIAPRGRRCGRNSINFAVRGSGFESRRPTEIFCGVLTLARCFAKLVAAHAGSRKVTECRGTKSKTTPVQLPGAAGRVAQHRASEKKFLRTCPGRQEPLALSLSKNEPALLLSTFNR